MQVDVRRFDSPDESRTFEKGRVDLVRVGGMTLGRATYEPGWKWSEHVGPVTGTALCDVEHVGVVLAGRVAVRMADGREFQLRAGDIFWVAPGHDSWVLGDETYVSIHLMGSDEYAAKPGSAGKTG
jgi:quercetin dioxygenase-like cupin family protein